MLPRISCAMITRDRPQFVGRAIRYFHQQTYLNRELVILDTSATPSVKPDQVSHSLVRYFHNPRGADFTIGRLRNAVIDVCNGDLIACWDDDDYYHPRRLAYQQEHMDDLVDGKPVDVLSFGSFLFFDQTGDEPAIWKYDNGTGRGGASSFMFRREFWKRNPFPSDYDPLKRQEEYAFCGDDSDSSPVRNLGIPGIFADGLAMLIARMHATNSQREVHAGIRRLMEFDPERISLVWSRIDDKATIERVEALLA